MPSNRKGRRERVPLERVCNSVRQYAYHAMQFFSEPGPQLKDRPGMFYEAWNFESGRKARYRETRTTSLLTRPRSILLLSSEKLQPFPGKRIVSDSFECRDLEPGDEDSESNRRSTAQLLLVKDTA